ncbi:DNA repair protein Rad50 [Clostridium perfringens]|uniref:DNA repair protein Rad50 n=1 Tax=Clostridium perfringens TaxID=1502 RepID=UPI0028CC51D5|nr:DNA repair protein Rad50 [Clostridium perfringens]MDT7916434.1 DNA repair protein Rad50 [Clostridium perfringens]MDT7936634.1 DNA repair protein Rad50 [Clostridium perfringens]MDT7939780.1 DNA repair protein Rad50 [Clostridium perfringens]MDT7965164.1 DNA repair protein Rad50 [Clostridium perfringens]MDT7989856.1 DNA repair protein Rad50 [Clostridium perfringens]
MVLRTKKQIETEVKEVDIMEIKRYMEIKNYLVSIWGIVNPNAEHQALVNPIAVKVAYSTLLELESELIGVELIYGDIDINNVFNNRYSNFTEEFILKTSNNTAYLHKEFEKIKGLKELNKVYPYEERKKRSLELQQEILKLTETNVKLQKINPSLVRQNEEKLKELRVEYNSLEETLNLKVKDELRFKIFSYADMELRETKNKVEEYRIYLEKLLRKMGEE